MNTTNSGHLTLLNLPASLRTTLYDTFFPSGYTIWLGRTTKASIGSWTSLFRTCRQLHTELNEYLSSKPVTLFCMAGHRPNILDRIPRCGFSKIEVVIIEDDPEPPIILGLLPALKCICFCERWQSKHSILGEKDDDSSAGSLTVVSDPWHVGFSTSLNRAKLLPLPSSNEALKTAHQFWKTLRIDHLWIRNVWRERMDLRVILRRLEEMEVTFPPGGERPDEGIIYSSHSVVDVSTKSMITSKYLPTRPKAENDDGVLFEYGAKNWWRLESGWKASEKAIA